MTAARQLALLDDDFALPESGHDNHGEVFTRRWIVELILDLVGYRSDRDLVPLRVVEPSCGTGAFLEVMAERLASSMRRFARSPQDAHASITAFDLQPQNVTLACRTVTQALMRSGVTTEEASELAGRWIHVGDYLLRDDDASADLVVGNPPYVRLEEVPDRRMAAYRAACPTMTGRADLYVGFIETALRSLRAGGAVGFICADRWMRNQYGAKLRELVSSRFSVDASIDVHDVDAFTTRVAAYPAITVMRRGPQRSAIVASTDSTFNARSARSFAEWAASGSPDFRTDGVRATRLPHWFDGHSSWPAGSPERLALLEQLNDSLPALEQSARGTRIGIGVATGADAVFVPRNMPDVERDRLLPLAMSSDTTSGELRWSGRHLVNPWDDEGRLVPLDSYPRLAAYLRRHAEAVRGRNVARRLPDRWYRTIDRVDPALAARPKLLFPDMKLNSHPVYDPGGLYPHHNLYYVVSDGWDLHVLGGLLLSGVAQLFIDAYSVRMRGGTLRFQAQYLRRIRVPRPSDLTGRLKKDLAIAFRNRDVSSATNAALAAYQLHSLPH